MHRQPSLLVSRPLEFGPQRPPGVMATVCLGSFEHSQLAYHELGPLHPELLRPSERPDPRPQFDRPGWALG